MTDSEYENLTAKLERQWQQNPQALLSSTKIMVGLAYGYLLLALLLCLAILLAGIFLLKVPKLGIVLVVIGGGFAISIIKGLWVRMEAPKGPVITRQAAPKLFQMLDDLSAKAGGAKFHEVQATPELNACVVQHPRLGIFGWPKNYLILGLPLMQAMTPEEFTGVLAHEFAHMSKSHGKAGNKIYRVRRTLEGVITHIMKDGQPSWLISKFISWFWPRFNARAFIISRANEYEADAFGATVAGAPVMASALTRLPLISLALEEHFWKDIGQVALTSPMPPDHLFKKMRHTLEEISTLHNLTDELTAAFNRRTDSSDTHPCLSDRLRALGQLPDPLPGKVPAVPEVTAAQAFMAGEAEQALMDKFSSEWKQNVAANWRAGHLEQQENQNKLQETTEQLNYVTSVKERERLLCRKLMLLQLLGQRPSPQADEALGQLLTANPDHPLGRFLKASDELKAGSTAAVTTLNELMWKEPTLTEDCFGTLYNFHERRAEYEQCQALKAQRDDLGDMMAESEAERTHVRQNDPIVPHSLAPEQMQELARFIQSVANVKHAWIVQKTMKHNPEKPHYIIALHYRDLFLTDNEKEVMAGKVANGAPFQDGSWVVIDKSNAPMDRIKRRESSQLF